MNKNPFILIPLPILRNLIIEPYTIEMMYDTGIFYTAQKINISEKNALREFVYCIYRAENELPPYLIQEYEDMEDFPYDEDLNGFCAGKFEPKSEIKYLSNYIQYNPHFYDLVVEWYSIRQVYKMLDLNTRTVPENIAAINSYQRTYNLNNCPFILLNGKVMQNLYNHRESIRSDERALWAMYMGILSIIGNKEFAQTTSSMIKCRMFGAKNKEELSVLLQDKSLKTAYEKYTTKYRYNKLLNIIQDRNMITEIALHRRTYVSAKLKNANALIDAILSKEKEVKQKKLRDEAKKKALIRYHLAKSK